jgi:hypothetical protein
MKNEAQNMSIILMLEDKLVERVRKDVLKKSIKIDPKVDDLLYINLSRSIVSLDIQLSDELMGW